MAGFAEVCSLGVVWAKGRWGFELGVIRETDSSKLSEAETVKLDNY